MAWSLGRATESLLLPLPWESGVPIAPFMASFLRVKSPPTPQWDLSSRDLPLAHWQLSVWRFETLRGPCSSCWLSPCEQIFLEIFFLTHGLPFASSVPMKVCQLTPAVLSQLEKEGWYLPLWAARKCYFWSFLGNMETTASVYHLCRMASDRRMGTRFILARAPRMIYLWPICKMHLEN